MNSINGNLSAYLQEKIKEKGFSMYEVYRRLGGDHTQCFLIDVRTFFDENPEY